METEAMGMKIVMTGGTGFIGTALVDRLRSHSHEVSCLTRADFGDSNGRLLPQIPQETAVLINLAGASIAGSRWTAAYRRKIRDSRIATTRSLVDVCLERMRQGARVPKVFISVSAVGYYGTNESFDFTENSVPGSSWLSQVACEWEAEASRVTEAGVRLVILRLGVVLGPGGFLARMKTPFLFFAGGPAGSGRQWISWIHREDVLAVIDKVLNDSTMSGRYNLTAPMPATMNEMAMAIGAALQRPAWLKTPAFALRLILGEMAEELILHGQRALPVRLREAGYRCQYPDLYEAVAVSFAQK
jgi:uncharacterized protein